MTETNPFDQMIAQLCANSLPHAIAEQTITIESLQSLLPQLPNFAEFKMVIDRQPATLLGRLRSFAGPLPVLDQQSGLVRSYNIRDVSTIAPSLLLLQQALEHQLTVSIEESELWLSRDKQTDLPPQPFELGRVCFVLAGAARFDSQIDARQEQQDELQAGQLIYLPKGCASHLTVAADSLILCFYLKPLNLANLLERKDLPADILTCLQKPLRSDVDLLARLSELNSLCAQAVSQNSFSINTQEKTDFIPSSPEWRLGKTSFHLETEEDIAKLSDGKRAVPVPPDMIEPLAWVLEVKHFNEQEFSESFSEMSADHQSRFLQDLQKMKVIKQA